MLRFFILFVVILVTLFAAGLTQPVQSAVVLPWTEALARISAGLITLFDSNVADFGKILQSTTNDFAISIEPFRNCVGNLQQNPGACRT